MVTFVAVWHTAAPFQTESLSVFERRRKSRRMPMNSARRTTARRLRRQSGNSAHLRRKTVYFTG
jgi:hypothetical protein